MRLAAKILLPRTGCVAFKLFMDLAVGLMMDLLEKRFLSMLGLALFDFQTISAFHFVINSLETYVKLSKIIKTLHPSCYVFFSEMRKSIKIIWHSNRVL